MAETKTQVVNRFVNHITELAPYLQACRVNPDDVQAWSTEPWEMNHIRQAIKWINNYLLPVVRKFISTTEGQTPQEIQRLAFINKKHPTLVLINNAREEVKQMWFKRPRFPNDKGRFEKEGWGKNV